MGILTRHHTDAPAELADPSGIGLPGDAEHRCCDDCGRVPLIGERVAHYDAGAMLCELCRVVCAERPVREALIKHSPQGADARVRVLRRVIA